jgi:hypothetical protein
MPKRQLLHDGGDEDGDAGAVMHRFPEQEGLAGLGFRQVQQGDWAGAQHAVGLQHALRRARWCRSWA